MSGSYFICLVFQIPDLKMANTTLNMWKPVANGTTEYTGAEKTEYQPLETTSKYGTRSDIFYDDYSYFTAEIHEEFLRNIHRHTSVFAVFLSVWTFFINMLVILACIGNREIRNNGYYNQIVNFSVSNLLISGFVIPLTIYHIQHSWDIGPALCKIYVIADVLLPFTSVVVILILNVDRLMSVVHPRFYSWIFQKSLKSAVVCLPWFTAVVVVIPIWTSGTMPYENKPGECIVLISKESAILCPLLTFFIPLVALIILTFKLLLLKIQVPASSAVSTDNTRLSMKTYKNEENGGENCELKDASSTLPNTSTAVLKEKRCDIVALCAVTACFAVMWFPFQCVSFLLSFCHSQSCIPSFGLNEVVTWLGASSAGVVPIFWFIDCQLRESLRAKCIKPRNADFNDSSNSEETFL